MKRIIYITLLIFCAVIAACNKDKSGWVTPQTSGLFVSEYGEGATTTFTYSNMQSLDPLYYPEGWLVSVSLSKRTISVLSPDSADDGDEHGELTLYGYDDEGSIVYVYMTVAKTETIAIDDAADDRQANCMILTEPNRIYTFNPKRRGESTDEQMTRVASFDIVWRTSNSPIAYPVLYDDGRVGIYTKCDYDDVDDDDDESDLVEGNALVAAYDSSGNILWSWHIWVTDSDPTLDPVTVNGVEFLPRNIGAFANSIASEDDILVSYGLYYQWGRREPFIYPYYFDASGSYDTPLYDNDGDYLALIYRDLSQSRGTIQYTQLHPYTFILGTDWKYDSNDALWGSGTVKSVYDPSPKGWRVPSSADLAGLSWSDGVALDDTYGYGTNLSDELFMALGRKVYYDGTVQNVSGDGTFSAWAGYYWSRDCVAGSDRAESLYFYVDRNSTPQSDDDTVVVENSRSMERGNGMQIRPVRDL